RAFEYLGQALHLRFGQRIAGTHAIADVKVFNHVGREIHHLAIGLPYIGQRTDAARDIPGASVDRLRTAQLAVGIVDGQAVGVEDFRRQRIVGTGLEPALVRVMHERRVGNVFAPERTGIEMVATGPLYIFAQG